MLILMKPGGLPEHGRAVCDLARGLECEVSPLRVHEREAFAVTGGGGSLDAALFQGLPGVDRVLPLHRALGANAGRDVGPSLPVVVGPATLGGGEVALIAGPCAVESEDQLVPLARRLRAAGATILRGGAFKPRTSPFDFQGLGRPGLELLERARTDTGLPFVTEAVDAASLELVAASADMIQIGTRNMHNFELLKLAGRTGLPVLLKRGFAATLEELLLAAEYVLEGGGPGVVLCERGIRTFSDHSRFTLDLSLVPRLRQLSRLPVIVDPSHASGHAEAVGPLSLAAIAAGADGVMIEVHADPLQALCDGAQALLPEQFEPLAADLTRLAGWISGRPEMAL